MARGSLRARIAGAVAGVLGISMLVGLSASPASAADEVVQKWLTTSDLSQHMTPQSNLGFTASSTSGTIGVDATQTFQTMDGFGAAMTDTSAWLLSNRLSSTAHTN